MFNVYHICNFFTIFETIFYDGVTTFEHLSHSIVLKVRRVAQVAGRMPKVRRTCCLRLKMLRITPTFELAPRDPIPT